MRYAAVLDGTAGTVTRQARALSTSLRRGLHGEPAGETVIFYDDEGAREQLIGLSPTPAVRLVRIVARRCDRHDRIVEVLAALAEKEGFSLFMFAGGYTGTELATRLAHRCDGTAITDALNLELGMERLICRKSVYSNHMVGRFELHRMPWCVSLDSSLDEEAGQVAVEHVVVADMDETTGGGESRVDDVELLNAPAKDDLESGSFIVIAGYGAGGREQAQRIAAAAQRMGAAFGATRAVVMNAWAPPDRLVGVSGTRTAPDICVVAGASGAAALQWGIEKAAFIVAINTDEHAPIVKNADVAVIDDAVTVIEELAEIASRAHMTRSANRLSIGTDTDNKQRT